ncbi:MAG: hypothetical protein VB980_07305 [Opitutales bacterium]
MKSLSYLLLACLLAFPAFAQDIITVTSTGFGKTAEDAEKSALQKAVRKALGEFVDAETLTDNEEIIKDEVLTYSDGFVRSKTVVNGLEKDPDLGLFTITIRAEVERNKVVERLRKVKIAVTEVSGEDLWAEAVSKAEGVKDGRRLLKKFLGEEMLPERLLEAQLVSKGDDGEVIRGPEAKPLQKIDYDNDTVDLTFHIETFYNLEDYDKKIVPRLIQLLDKICKQKIEQSAPVAMERPGSARISPKVFCTESPTVIVGTGRRSLHGTPGSGKMYIGQWSRALDSLKLSENVALVACNVERDKRGKNHRFAIYALDADAYARIFMHAPGVIIPRINLVLEDGDGEVIRHERWFPRECVFTNIRQGPAVELVPAFDGIGTTISRAYQSAYGINGKVSYGLVSMGSGRGGEKHFTISPWFSFERANFISAAPVLERKLTLDQEDLKRLKSVKVFYEGLGQPKQ